MKEAGYRPKMVPTEQKRVSVRGYILEQYKPWVFGLRCLSKDFASGTGGNLYGISK